ncbi:MAG TPA: hypothetical protein VGM64_21600 [Lacunisphaera sp.]|jgi:hypothetical protein
MVRRVILPLLLLLSAGSLVGAEDWSKLKIGMSTDQTAEILGAPLIRTVANGFELWIYDNHAEALFFGGPLIGWTTPKTSKSPAISVDVWQHKVGQPEGPVFILSRYHPPVKKVDLSKTDGVYSLPYYRLKN